MQAPTLTTKDLILRPSAAADLQTFSEWERIPAVTEFFSIRDGQTLEEVTEKFQKDDADPGAAQLTICLKDGTLTRRQLQINATRVARMAKRLTEKKAGGNT